MRPSFFPRLVNGPFDDPGLFVPFLFEKRAILFDLGDVHALSAKEILKISHIFITHTHMDHFAGFERVLRLLLGREKELHLFGPEGFLKNIENKLGGYTWNLVENYSHSFTLTATEVRSGSLLTARYPCQNRFRPTGPPQKKPYSRALINEPSMTVSAEVLDHGIPCLGFSMAETFHVNIKKDSLAELGLDIGPWLRDFKQALFNAEPRESIFEVKGGNSAAKNQFVLGELSDRIAMITPGQKITYIADVVYSQSNTEKIVEFAGDSDQLFIEAAFLEQDKEIARKKFHLTARQAGAIASEARAKQLAIFHFSPRYADRAHLLYAEAERAFAGE